MSAQTIDFQADPRVHRESGFVPQPTSPEAAAAPAATSRESFLPWTTPASRHLPPPHRLASLALASLLSLIGSIGRNNTGL